MSLRGQTALITGGGKNLGAEIARVLAKEGANLALHYNSASSKDSTSKLKDKLLNTYKELTIFIHHGDLTTGTAVEGLFKDVVAQHDNVDICREYNWRGIEESDCRHLRGGVWYYV